MKILDLKNELEKRSKSIHQWAINCKSLQRDESYLVSKNQKICLEQSRNVNTFDVNVRLWVPKQGGRLGFISQNIKLDDKIGPHVDLMIEKANLSSQEPWVFPQNNSSIEYNKSLYEAFEKDLTTNSQKVVNEFKSAIENEKSGEFNSGELFITNEKSELWLSTGFQGKHSRTKIYGEVCYSHREGKESNEFLVTRMACHPEQMNFSELCRTSANGARALLSAQNTPSGTYNCMVDAEVLGQLYSDAITHLDGGNFYFNMPFMEKGKTFIKDYKGDDFRLSLDPHIEFALGSCAFNSESMPQKRLELIGKNKVCENIISNQIAQYLNWSPTSQMGNLVLEIEGGKTREELLSQGPVLEILQFSALFSSPRDLAFSSEIRLGRLWRPGQEPIYVRGGNFSGQFFENFRKVQFSKESIFINLNEEALEYPRAYKGPAFAVLNDVIVSA